MDSIIEGDFYDEGFVQELARNDHSLGLWYAHSGRYIRAFEGHRGQVNAVCLSETRRLGISASSDHTLRSWNINTRSYLRIFQGHTFAVLSVCLSTDGLLALWQ
jgi:WD40 repeat protein